MYIKENMHKIVIPDVQRPNHLEKKKLTAYDLLAQSEINVMEGNHDSDKGKTNLRYNPSNGTLDIPFNLTRHHSVPNGKLPLDDSHCFSNGKIPLDRFSSVAGTSVSTRYENTSILQLVIDKPGKKSKQNSKKLKYGGICVILILIIALASLLTLYTLKVKKEKDTHPYIDVKRESCFVRASAIKIANVILEPEIQMAIKASIKQFKNLSLSNVYNALSVNVLYMNEVIWSYNLGKMNYTNKSSSTPNSDTPYPIASASKIFTVMMLQQLVEIGKIKSLDDEIEIYEPDFSIINPFNNEKITFRQLSCMMSGMPRESPCYRNPRVRDNVCPFTTDEMLKKIKKISLLLPPGTKPSYSNLAIALLGGILERRLTNETMEQWIDKKIIKPLNLRNTGFVGQTRPEIFPVSSTIGGQKADILDWGWLRPTGGMFSTINDLSKLGSVFLQLGNETVLSKGSVNEMMKHVYVWSDQSFQGCPFEIYALDPYHPKNPQIGYIVYTKSGATFGYETIFALVPDLKLNFNILGASPIERHTAVPLRLLSRNFITAFDMMLKRKDKKLHYVLPSNPEHFIGTYTKTTYWPFIVNTCNITMRTGKLYLELETWKIPLTYSSNYTLKTFNEDQTCSWVSTGLINNDYIFVPPDDSSPRKCKGFHVNGITAYGYIAFERIH